MKYFFTIIACFAFVGSNLLAQDACSPYYSLKKGSSWTLEHYNKKDKLQGSTSHTVQSVEADGNGQLINVLLKSFDKKGKLELEKEVEFRCENGRVEFDMSTYIPDESMEAFKDMDIEVELDPIIIPEELTIGQSLKDANMKFTVSGPMSIKLNYYLENRTVLAKEEVEVPAGKFTAFKIASNMRFESMMSKEFKIVDYIVEDIGAVKTETYNNKGKLLNYSILTKHSN